MSTHSRLSRSVAHADHAEHLLAQARCELAAATVLVNSAALPEDACGMPGPVCSACLGTALTRTGNGAVACPNCGRAGTAAQTRHGHLCPRPTAVTIAETSDSELAVCLSHAVSLLRRTPRATVEQADRADLKQLVRVLDHRCASPCERPRHRAAGGPSRDQRHERHPGRGAAGRAVRDRVAALGMAADADLRAVSEVVGHSSIVITADAYTSALLAASSADPLRVGELPGGQGARVEEAANERERSPFPQTESAVRRRRRV